MSTPPPHKKQKHDIDLSKDDSSDGDEMDDSDVEFIKETEYKKDSSIAHDRSDLDLTTSILIRKLLQEDLQQQTAADAKFAEQVYSQQPQQFSSLSSTSSSSSFMSSTSLGMEYPSELVYYEWQHSPKLPGGKGNLCCGVKNRHPSTASWFRCDTRNHRNTRIILCTAHGTMSSA